MDLIGEQDEPTDVENLAFTKQSITDAIQEGTGTQAVPPNLAAYARNAEAEGSEFRRVAAVSRLLSNIVHMANLPLPPDYKSREQHFAQMAQLEKLAIESLERMANEVARMHNANTRQREDLEDIYLQVAKLLGEEEGREVVTEHARYQRNVYVRGPRVQPIKQGNA